MDNNILNNDIQENELNMVVESSNEYSHVEDVEEEEKSYYGRVFAEVDFSNGDLSEYTISYCNFVNCKFVNCKLIDSIIDNCNCVDCDFSNANLTRAQLLYSKFDNVNVENTITTEIEIIDSNWPK